MKEQKFKVGDDVRIIYHKNKGLIGTVSTINAVVKDVHDNYLYKVRGIKDWATEKDIERINL